MKQQSINSKLFEVGCLSQLRTLAYQGEFEEVKAINAVMNVEESMTKRGDWTTVIDKKDYGEYIRTICTLDMDLNVWCGTGFLPITESDRDIIKQTIVMKLIPQFLFTMPSNSDIDFAGRASEDELYSN